MKFERTITSIFLCIGLLSCSGRSNTQESLKSQDPDYLYVSRLADRATITSGANSVGSLSVAAPNLSAETLEKHLDGDAKFERNFIPGPDSQHPEHVGLGPAFNNVSCRACHMRDGRGTLPPIPVGQASVMLGSNESVLIRISIEAAKDGEPGAPVIKDAAHDWGAPQAVPGFSGQLYHRGVWGLRPDSPGSGQADVYLSYTAQDFTYPDGRTVSLRKPIFKLENAYDGPKSRLYQSDVRTSPRLAPPMIGLGLLEAIPEEQILAHAGPSPSGASSEEAGISGKPNWVLDLSKKYANESSREGGPLSLGRFGWKGSNPTIRQQTIAALSNDMGITSQWLPVQNIFGTPLYEQFMKSRGGDPTSNQLPEVNEDFVNSVTVYGQTLGVPERRNVNDPKVVRGGRIFQQISCAKCHAGGYVLNGPTPVEEFKGMKIYPFTDLLLHDMGDGLADGRRDFDADGTQWKTPPLWGIGLTQLVNSRARFLHDGRARSIEEAVLWHGGEAARACEKFKKLSVDDRDSLLAFLGSL